MTKSEILTMEDYARVHPNVTLEEYVEHVKNIEKALENEEIERQHNILNWYKELEGRYFVINFNGNAFIALYVNKWPDLQYDNEYDCYEILLRESKLYLEKRSINRQWFCNPYEYNDKYTKCYEITKEEFESIKEKASKVKETVNSINLKR